MYSGVLQLTAQTQVVQPFARSGLPIPSLFNRKPCISKPREGRLNIRFNDNTINSRKLSDSGFDRTKCINSKLCSSKSYSSKPFKSNPKDNCLNDNTISSRKLSDSKRTTTGSTATSSATASYAAENSATAAATSSISQTPSKIPRP